MRFRPGQVKAFLAIAMSLLLLLPAHAEKRVALVIGNNAYKHLTPLNNPVPDATALAALLREHGFVVTERHNLDLGNFQVTLADFRADSGDADVVVVYYAGHGMQLENRDVLAPIDLEYQCPREGEPTRYKRAVTLDEFFDKLGSDRAKTVVLIDACRNAPFARCPKRAADAGSGLTFRALARIGPQPRSLLIANATLPGFLTEDGEMGRHSPFAKALLARLKAHPETLLRDVLDLTARDVSTATGGLQIPEVIVRGGTPQVCLRGDGCGPSEAARQWTAVNKNSIAELEGFIRQHPSSPQAGYAEEMRAALETAERAQEALRLAQIQRQEALLAAELAQKIAREARAALESEPAKQREASSAAAPRYFEYESTIPIWLNGVWQGTVRGLNDRRLGDIRTLRVVAVKSDGSGFGVWAHRPDGVGEANARMQIRGDTLSIVTIYKSVVTLRRTKDADRLEGTFRTLGGRILSVTLKRKAMPPTTDSGR